MLISRKRQKIRKEDKIPNQIGNESLPTGKYSFPDYRIINNIHSVQQPVYAYSQRVVTTSSICALPLRDANKLTISSARVFLEFPVIQSPLTETFYPLVSIPFSVLFSFT